MPWTPVNFSVRPFSCMTPHYCIVFLMQVYENISHVQRTHLTSGNLCTCFVFQNMTVTYGPNFTCLHTWTHTSLRVPQIHDTSVEYDNITHTAWLRTTDLQRKLRFLFSILVQITTSLFRSNGQVLSLCLIKHDAIRPYWGEGDGTVGHNLSSELNERASSATFA